MFDFDNSMSHHKRHPNGLDASLLNKRDGGKNVPKMRDTEYERDGQVYQQLMQTAGGIQKGLQTVLQERGKWRPGMLRLCNPCLNKVPMDVRRTNGYYVEACCAVYVCSQEPDFLAQREWLREVVEDRGHKIIFFPKYHCELNYIEKVWGWLKSYLRRHCTYKFKDLQTLLPKVIKEQLPLPFIRRAERHCFRMMSGYRQGFEGPLLDFTMRQYTSHRRIPNFVYDLMKEKFAKKRKHSDI